MLRLKKVLYTVFNTEPHLKAIKQVGIKHRNLVFNPSVPELYEIAFLNEPPSDPHTRPSLVSSNGALCAYSGKNIKLDVSCSRIVKDQETEKTVNWGQYNQPIEPASFGLVNNFAVDYLNHRERCLVVDGYVGWDPKHRLKVRAFCTRSYHALFMRNLLVRPTQKEYEEDFTKGVDINMIHAGEMEISKNIGVSETGSINALNLRQNKIVIMGTQFAGEMKKSIIRILHYSYPRKKVLTLHGAATEGKDGKSTVICGLESTGKTMLAIKSQYKKLIANDDLCWSEDGIFSADGGFYTKLINFNEGVQPQMLKPIKFGTIVENANFYANSRTFNFNDSSISSYSRAAFPQEYVRSPEEKACSSHPNNFILLTCDSNGVLPPVAKLTHEQAYYYFLSGYTTSIEDNNIKSIFSSCFAEQYLPLSPEIYAKMFYDRIKKHDCNVWMINTGWRGGKAGSGKRIPYDVSVSILNAINAGKLHNAEFDDAKFFNFKVPKSIDGVDLTEQEWSSKVQHEETRSSLAVEFMTNFQKKFKGDDLAEIKKAGPTI